MKSLLVYIYNKFFFKQYLIRNTARNLIYAKIMRLFTVHIFHKCLKISDRGKIYANKNYILPISELSIFSSLLPLGSTTLRMG